jgi:inner membrane protein involved in colicin E2 resistance
MTGFRFFLIILIFTMIGVAWLVLGGTIEYRTANADRAMTEEVNARWGPSSLVQPAPCLVTTGYSDATRASAAIDPAASTVTVDFVHEHRYMGLVWFSTYTARFAGEYAVQAPEAAKAGQSCFVFRLPDRVRTFEDLNVTLDGKPVSVETSGNVQATLEVAIPADGQRHAVSVSYAARGRDRWEYEVGKAEGGRIPLLQNFTMTTTTNFMEIDYPKGSISPVKKAEAARTGMKAVWQYNNLRAAQRMGIEMPAVPEAGAVAARMSYFAPVSLFFFFTVLVTIVILKKIPLHPMHYLLVSAAFFAFHILMAYLVDKIDIEYAFWICAAVSVFLVVSYIRLVAGAKFALVYVGLAQLVYLVGFSYAFFWKGWTGLTVVIVAIITLFVLMQATGRLDWNAVFRKPAIAPPPPPLPKS